MRPIVAPRPTAAVAPAVPATFSAIVPAYEAATYIGDAIESLLGQTVPPIEIIVCDDGSRDDLEGALKPYRDRIILLQKENGGEASAKNVAARAASGEFVAILDADDIYYPERLEALAELNGRRPDLDILTSDCLVVSEGRVVRNCYSGGYAFESSDQRKGILERNFIGPGHMAVRRERLLAIGGFDETFRWATDWDCWIRLIFDGSRAGMVDEPLSEYRVRETSLASNRIRQFQGYVAVLQKAAARSDLLDAEREVVNASLALQRRRLAVQEAWTALIEDAPEARRSVAGIALGRRVPARTRLLAAVAAALPRSAGRRIARARRELAGGVRAY